MKKTYHPIELQVIFLRLEHGFAAGSATVNVGNSANQYTPNIDGWDTGITSDTDFDI